MFAAREHRAGEASGALPRKRTRATLGFRRLGPRGRLRSSSRTYPWAYPRGPEVGALGVGRGAPGGQPSSLRDLAPGWARDPLTAPHSWRAAACPGVSVAASASHGLTLEASLGEGATLAVLLAASRFDPGMYLPKSLVPSLPLGSPAPVLVRIVSLLQQSPSYSQR